MPQTLQLIYCPFPSLDAAREVATQLLEQHLVACCNLLPAGESLYLWQGTLTTASEVVLIAKTSLEKAPLAVAAIAAAHPYECPAILSFQANSNDHFAAWLTQVLKD